jgi:hypothetical protein
MSSGSALGMLANFVIFSIASSTIGFVFDVLTNLMNGYGTGLPMDAFNTISNLHLIYIAGPFIYALALGYNHIVTSVSESDQMV